MIHHRSSTRHHDEVIFEKRLSWSVVMDKYSHLVAMTHKITPKTFPLFVDVMLWLLSMVVVTGSMQSLSNSNLILIYGIIPFVAGKSSHDRFFPSVFGPVHGEK